MASFTAKAGLSDPSGLGDAAGLDNCAVNDLRLPSVTVTRRVDGCDGPGDGARVEAVAGLRVGSSRHHGTHRTRSPLSPGSTGIERNVSNFRGSARSPADYADAYS